jgi:hypothetical protein
VISQAQGSETKAYPAISGYDRLGGFATILFLYYNFFFDLPGNVASVSSWLGNIVLVTITELPSSSYPGSKPSGDIVPRSLTIQLRP